MPIIRIDIPEGHDKVVKNALYEAVHHSISTNWAKEHIWIALGEKFSPPGNAQVIVTVDLRPGRGGEEERLHAFFDDVQRAFEDIIGTTREDLIVLIRDFPQEACLSEGKTLPPLEALTPELDTA